MATRTLRTDEVIFRDDLYPRIETRATTVQQYAEDLEVLPPIEVNQRNELIDGWHRWTAHRKQEVEMISVSVTETTSDMHLLELAIERNAKHGLQLSQKDKRDCAIRIYLSTPISERRGKRAHLAKILGISEAKLSEMLSRTDKEERDKRNRRIFKNWLACYTQEEIAEVEGLTREAVAKILVDFSDMKKLPKTDQARAEHNDGNILDKDGNDTGKPKFTIPLYNVWKQQDKTEGSKHFGNSEVRWVDNLLYLYTKPFDVVVDPFAGGGSTVDICRKRLRRYYVSDRKPAVEREDDIRQHDITSGLPKLSRWKDVALVYLDPPYWKQAEGQYSDDPEDLANMSLEDFNATLSKLITSFAKKMKAGSHIALIIQPTQWKAPERQYTDHIADMLRAVKLPLVMRIQAPYESQQCNAQMVEWAKKQRTLLVISRELIIWRV